MYDGHLYNYTIINGKMKCKEKAYKCAAGSEVDHRKYWPKGMKALPEISLTSGLEETESEDETEGMQPTM
jgi:hypothetical protein